jgi:hypothetical protein
LDKIHVGASPTSPSGRTASKYARRRNLGRSSYALVAIFLTTLVAGARAEPRDQGKSPEAPRNILTPPLRANAPSRTVAVPAPPRRPQKETLPSPPAPSAIAPPPRPALLSELPPLDVSVPPPTLPRAARATMRGCALEWEKLKLEGRTAGLMWRDFAEKCLTR